MSAGNAAQGVAFAARARRRAVLGDGDGHRAADQAARDRAARRHHRHGHLRRMLADRRSARARRACAATSCIRSTTTISSPATRTAGLEILEDLPDVDAVVAALGGGGLLAGIGSVMRARKPGVRDLRRRTRNRGAARRCRCGAAKRSCFDAWQPSFVDGAGGKSVLPTMWPLLQGPRRRIDRRCRSTRSPPAMRKTAERVHVVAEGAGGTRDRRGAQRPRRHRKDRRRRLRRQHRSLAILPNSSALTPHVEHHV